MKPRLVALLVLGVLLLGLPYASRALMPPEAPAVANQARATRTVHAVFSSTNGAGVVTDLDVYAIDGPDGGEVTIEVSRYRTTCPRKGCPEVIFHAFNQAPLAPSDLQFGDALSSATLRATFPVSQRLARGSDTVSVDLTWTAVGRLTRNEHEEGERFSRATASGSIRSGKTNFTPKASVDAQIEEWG